jgi:SAM-dependent methyltransferase
LVHTDIHEHNICFREEAPVLCDLEEARYLKQDLDFERSLDVVGVNRYGNVGEFPSRPGIPRGFTCLQRLEAVFRQLIRKRLPELINRCNFDDSCPFNLDELQEPDHRIYQSVDLPDLKVDGHRPRHDPRLWLFTYLLRRLSRRNAPIIHLDIGSNLGRFCFEAAALPFVRESIGLEAYANYVDLSRVLAFLYGVAKAKFFRFTCGEERLPDRLQGVTLVTMLSVYHHVKNKEALLTDLKKLEAPYLLAEFATQERYYPQRGDLSAELAYIRAMTGYAHSCLLAVSLDYQRPIVLFANQAVATLDRVLLRLASSRYFALRRIAMIAAHLLPGPC